MEPSFLQMVVTVDSIARKADGNVWVQCELHGQRVEFMVAPEVAARFQYGQLLTVRVDPYKADG